MKSVIHAPAEMLVLATMAFASVLSLAGCEGSLIDPSLTEGGFGLSQVTVNAVGDTVVIPVHQPTGADSAPISWSTSDPQVVLMTTEGALVSAGVGTAVVGAESCYSGNCWQDSASVNVRQIPATVAVTPTSGSIHIGEQIYLSASAADSNGTAIGDASFQWSSSNLSVASVDEDGIVTAAAEGFALITAALEETTGQATLTVTSQDSPGSGELAELPRHYVDTEYPTLSGDTLRVSVGGDLQAALNTAQSGDLVLLESGATFVGNFVLPPRADTSGWIVVKTEGSLPPVGTRATPQSASVYARILSPNSDAPLQAGDDAAYYRVVGVEIAAESSVSTMNGLVRLEGAGVTKPHHIVFDRVYIHGHSGLYLRRCVMLNSAWTAVIDSYLEKCHSQGEDSQAIVGWDGPGPFKIVNNHLEGAGENVMFGGADATSAEMIPRDIEIRRNHFYKPPEWRGVWTVKNLLELKTAVRVVIEGNVFENTWLDAQDVAILFKSINQGGGYGEFSKTTDVIFRYNHIINIGNAFNLSANPEGTVEEPLSRVVIAHNRVESLGPESSFGGAGRAFSAGGAIQGLYIHNNWVDPDHSVLFLTGEPMSELVFSDNAFGPSSYGVKGDGTSTGLASLNNYTVTYTFLGNILAGEATSVYPDANCFPPTVDQASGCAAAGPDNAALDAWIDGVRSF